MIHSYNLHLELKGDEILVTMPDTTFKVVYPRPNCGAHLRAKLNYFQDEQKGPVSRAEFVDRAAKLADAKARELGWIA